jgi:hypothetical protein
MLARVLVALLLGVTAAQAADGVPKLDMRPGCRAAVQAGAVVNRDLNTCLRSENAALDKLKEGWKNFVAEDRTRCINLTQMGGPPSYVEVLTCVEMARDARQIRASEPKPIERPSRR